MGAKFTVEDIVLEEVQGPSHQFSPFYHNNSLLIQLMITEMIHIHQIASKISNCNHEIESLSSQLFELVNDLSFSSYASYSNRSKGALNRLKEFTDYFYSNANNQVKNRTNLHDLVNHAWISVIQNLLLIKGSKICKDKRKESILLSRIKNSIKTLIARIHRMSKAIIRLLPLFENDESVVYFLLRKRNQLIEIFGSDQMKRVFKSISKKTPLEKLLINRYLTKGFYHLIPLIKQELSLHEPCQYVNS